MTRESAFHSSYVQTVVQYVLALYRTVPHTVLQLSTYVMLPQYPLSSLINYNQEVLRAVVHRLVCGKRWISRFCVWWHAALGVALDASMSALPFCVRIGAQKDSERTGKCTEMDRWGGTLGGALLGAPRCACWPGAQITWDGSALCLQCKLLANKVSNC